MTPSRDNFSGYDSFWTEVESTSSTTKQADSADANAASVAIVDE